MHMVHQDTVFHSFWHNKRHFADLCNALIYEGKQVVHPASLQDMDSEVLRSDLEGIVIGEERGEQKGILKTAVNMLKKEAADCSDPGGYRFTALGN